MYNETIFYIFYDSYPYLKEKCNADVPPSICIFGMFSTINETYQFFSIVFDHCIKKC